MIEHGAWGEWLEKSVDYSQRTAQNLMKIFEEYGSADLKLGTNVVGSFHGFTSFVWNIMFLVHFFKLFAFQHSHPLSSGTRFVTCALVIGHNCSLSIAK